MAVSDNYFIFNKLENYKGYDLRFDLFRLDSVRLNQIKFFRLHDIILYYIDDVR